MSLPFLSEFSGNLWHCCCLVKGCELVAIFVDSAFDDMHVQADVILVSEDGGVSFATLTLPHSPVEITNSLS